MIIEIPNENSIVKWKNGDKDEWKYAEISDLIKAYERPKGEWIFRQGVTCGGYYKCNICGEVERAEKNFCPNCGAEMVGGES